ncbi:UDP-glucuronosyltransferase 2B30-like [Lingula anatina]|uniref:UDP-glucuronosyltransferase n=1 Tax=Lingula anatina TaxID=7574 RepID=A0A1S3HCK4_LINAN|nr:UDP-glucuronosyltransferase 2B30-like [Lingula anatina]|eukprot:XP_013383735.1 UDP-glucuronosyltransferase 2B30-like [Lingula anatina]
MHVRALVLMHVVGGICGDNILLYPYSVFFNSRIMNMEKLALMLRDHGHNVTILVEAAYQPTRPLAGVHLEKFTVKNTPLVTRIKQHWDFKAALEFVHMSFPKQIAFIEEVSYSVSDSLLGDREVMNRIKHGNYSLFIYDWIDLFGPILVQYLNIPTIIYSNYGFENCWSIFHNPVNPAYIPVIQDDHGYSDEMSFFQRLQNAVLFWVTEYYLNIAATNKIENLKRKHFPDVDWPHVRYAGEKVSLIIAANVHFAFDYPRPVMPHVKPISGLLHTAPRPLPAHLEAFMSSAANGVILLSWGTAMATLDKDQAEILAKVFAKLPQKVIWRYKGPRPAHLGNNTLLVDWLPQNDVLAHVNTKLFITHCGVSSSWETMIHGVPVVAVPLWGDQYHQATKLVTRVKMGVKIEFKNLNAKDFEDAILIVLQNSEYKENAMKISELLRDQALPAKEQFLYWVDYVIRHKGPLFFRSHATYRLACLRHFTAQLEV